ncbi:hypothetical protein [Methylocystis sp. MJC1]|uniref:hypothetical protein n=1 Tax=Methylocystis sp. MJC1 TaxID=2654282 RepID=UPI0027D2A999|nr:hypothetical protein [Methylocystis sp. MJC1]
MTAIATIVLGVSLMIQGGTVLSDYAQVSVPTEASSAQLGGSGLVALFLAGAAGIVLGVLGILGVHTTVLSAIAMISFGVGLLLSSNSLWIVYAVRRSAVATSARLSREMLANEIASGSAGIQALAGIAAIVLGLIALAGHENDLTVNLAALVAVGGALVLTGSSLSATVLGLMREPS